MKRRYILPDQNNNRWNSKESVVWGRKREICHVTRPGTEINVNPGGHSQKKLTIVELALCDVWTSRKQDVFKRTKMSSSKQKESVQRTFTTD